MPRYQWRKPSDLPDRLELVDGVTSKPIATIMQTGQDWSWKRSTAVLLHGAPPAEGFAKSLAKAKECVVKGLPNGQ